ncbi:MAG TPA: cation:proton antiporter [Vicinamibacterales bacterium]|nr:cation:proton antiporter [Vicinamibacterales bacterium]
MVAGAVGLVLLVLRYGEGLSAPAPIVAGPTITGPGAGTEGVALHLLIALTAVVVVGRLLGRLFRSVGQPPVIGEVVGGVLLGPSLLGILAPDVYNFLLPPSIVSPLGIFAQLGVVLYMFLVGLDLDSDLLRGQLHATVAISHASIVLPFVLGATLALYLYPRVSTNDVAFSSFALFLGIAMSITAFPVLARILSDLGMSRSPLGVLALTCAAVDDVTAWCLLALVVGVAQAAAGRALVVTALTLAFIGVMFTIVRPLVARLASQGNAEPTFGDFAVIIASLLVASTITEVIGVHAIFGAFLFGAVIPHDSPLARRLTGVLERPVTILLLPAFFAFAGMRTEIGLLAGWSAWLTCALIVVVATAGKVGGTLMAGRATGLSWREAAGLGVLMNTRGLMQLIVLNVGLDLGVISPTLFTMMVLMAIATTLATTPVLRRVL